VLQADAALAGEFAEARLAPLAELRPGARERLTASLGAWLDCQGRVDETARALDIHPQTVRYRLNQLREAFGGVLDDPEGRFELALALRVRSASASHAGGA
jgi:DNA-binding PucR family transcriptional regulator